MIGFKILHTTARQFQRNTSWEYESNHVKKLELNPFKEYVLSVVRIGRNEKKKNVFLFFNFFFYLCWYSSDDPFHMKNSLQARVNRQQLMNIIRVFYSFVSFGAVVFIAGFN